MLQRVIGGGASMAITRLPAAMPLPLRKVPLARMNSNTALIVARGLKMKVRVVENCCGVCAHFDMDDAADNGEQTRGFCNYAGSRMPFWYVYVRQPVNYYDGAYCPAYEEQRYD